MSAGAVFKLIANDGKADRMIMATKLLNQRIKDVMCARNAAGKADITPTIVDLERTHILYVNAHFKPFAAIGYEYNKVRAQSGNATLGSGCTFSIPQFGDFFHDMVCHVAIDAVQADLLTLPALPTPAEGSNTYYNYVTAFGYKATAGSQYRNLVRYCEFPGTRLFGSVKFDVNGNPLDNYDDIAVMMLEKFCTPPHKRTGFNRLVGQETILDGYSGPIKASAIDPDGNPVGTLQTPGGVITRNAAGQSNQTVALFQNGAAGSVVGTVVQTLNSNGTAGAPTTAVNPWGAASAPQFDVSREYKQFLSGPQTPKPQQPRLEIWNKLRFWFNDDVRLSIPSVSIPFGQRFITIEMRALNQLVYEFPSMYLETIYESSSTGVSAASGIYAEHDESAYCLRQKTYSPITTLGGISASPNVSIELYINNIFVNPEIHDIYIKRIGFSLIRVYREQNSRVSSAAGEVLLSQLKWPIEYMFIGARPIWNNTQTNPNIWRDWHRLTYNINAVNYDACQSEVPLAAPSGGITISGPTMNGQALFGSNIYDVVPDQYYLPVPTIDAMSLTSHGINIYDYFADQFFGAYLPFHYGGTSLVTPDDVGALFINMALFPRSYQPSGHLNISRARETYFKWTSSYVSSTSPVEMLIVAVAINFLLITDGSAVLRYST